MTRASTTTPTTTQAPAVNDNSRAAQIQRATSQGFNQPSSGGGSSQALPQYDAQGGFTSGGQYYAPNSIQAQNSRAIPNSNIIPDSTLSTSNTNSKVTFPNTVVPLNDSANILGGLNLYANQTITGNKEQDALAAQRQNTQNSALQAMINNINNRPSDESILTGLEDKYHKQELKQKVNDLSGQLNMITANGQALQQSVVGQGRGIPEAIIGGQQAEIGRQTAINALPVAAQLQFAQGNLQAAEESINKMFAVKSADAKSRFENVSNLIKTFYDFASSEDKIKLEYAQKKEERAYNEGQKVRDTNNALAIEVGKNGGTSKQIQDVANATDFKTAIKAAGSSLATSQNDVIKLDNGTTLLVNKRTGAVVKNFGGAKPSDNPVIVQRQVNGAPVEGYKLITGDDPYFVAKKYGTDIAGLKALNPGVKDWANLPVGATLNVPSNPAKVAQNTALSTILGSGKFTKEQKADLVNSINHGQDPFTTIKNQAKNIAGQTEATKITSYETAQSVMNDLNTQLKSYYAAGGTTNILTGKYEKVINNLGEVKDPKLVDLATQISASLQVYRNAISGTAYSVQEGADIARIFPGITKSEGLNNAILQGRSKAFDSVIDGSYKTVLGSSYDALKQNSKPPIDPMQNIKSYGDAHPEARSIMINMQKDNRTVEEINNWVNQHTQ